MKVTALTLACAAVALAIGGCAPYHGVGMGPQGATGYGDMGQMCSMYRQAATGGSPAEQRAAIEAQMQAMHGGTLSPEQLRVRRETMERNCAGVPASR